MKAFLKSDVAFDKVAQAPIPPELSAAPQALTRRRCKTKRQAATGSPVRSITVFRLTATLLCLTPFVAMQHHLAVLFDDELAALIVTMTIAATAVALGKPCVFPPRRHR